jgi:hypothetical protein
VQFNQEKCTLGFQARKFLVFLSNQIGNWSKSEQVQGNCWLSHFEIEKVSTMLTSLLSFVAKSTKHSLPLFKLLWKETTFEWAEECKATLQHLKQALSKPWVLSLPEHGEVLYLCLVVASQAINTRNNYTRNNWKVETCIFHQQSLTRDWKQISTNLGSCTLDDIQICICMVFCSILIK